jgi:hypothetical protein
MSQENGPARSGASWVTKESQMMGRVRWSHVTIALAVIAALAIASPVFGVSIKKLVKKEVSKQISKATGPAGPQGTAGTARAYALVSASTAPTAANAFFRKGINTPVAHPSAGIYCVAAPGLDPTTTPAVVSAETAGTSSPEGNTTAQPFVGAAGCPADTFPVATFRIPSGTPVNATLSDSVAFTIVIP